MTRHLAAAALLLLAGCVSAPPPAKVVASQDALIRWRLGRDVFAGKATIARDAQGGVSVVVSQSDGKTATFRLTGDGLLVLPTWHGTLAEAPTHAKIWIQALTILQRSEAIPEGRREIHSPGLRAAVEKRGGRLVGASLLDNDTGETLTLALLATGNDRRSP